MRFNKKFGVSIFIFSLICSFVGAQSSASNITVTQKNENSSFYKRLEWESSGVVKKYQVIVEKNVASSKNAKPVYEEIFSDFTTDTFYNASLDKGSYRFKVIFFNVLGKAAFETSYQYFEILVAYEPEVNFKSDSSIYLNEKEFNGQFSFKVKNISKDAQIYMENLKSEKDTKASVIYPEKINFSENQLDLIFDTKKLPEGNYRIYVKNPGGLTATSGTIRIRNSKQDFFRLTACYDLETVLYDDLIPSYFGSRVVPLGMNLNFTYLRKINSSFKAGVGFVVRFGGLNYKTDSYYLSGNLFSSHLNAVADYTVFEKKNLSFSVTGFAGAGAESLLGLQFKYPDGTKSLKASSILFGYDFGISGNLCLNKKILIQAGTEFVGEIPSRNVDYNIGTLNIFAGAGVQL